MGRWTDLVVAAGTGGFVGAATLLAAANGGGAMTVLGSTLIVGSSVVLGWRRRFPVAVLCATLLACSLYYPLTGPGSPIVLTFVVALFTAAAEGRLAVAVGTAATAMALMLLGESASPKQHLDSIALFLMAGWFVVWTGLTRFTT